MNPEEFYSSYFSQALNNNSDNESRPKVSNPPTDDEQDSCKYEYDENNKLIKIHNEPEKSTSSHNTTYHANSNPIGSSNHLGSSANSKGNVQNLQTLPFSPEIEVIKDLFSQSEPYELTTNDIFLKEDSSSCSNKRGERFQKSRKLKPAKKKTLLMNKIKTQRKPRLKTQTQLKVSWVKRVVLIYARDPQDSSAFF